MKSICLVMIVKNEAAVIRRCLDSVKPIIDSWIVCDTGSMDGTQEVVREALRDVPGTLHDIPWIDFGQARTAALKLAKGKAKYHLLIDADMTVNVDGKLRDNLTADCYLVRQEGDVEYWVTRLVSDRHNWQYIGATHEFIHAGTAENREKLPELSVRHHEDGGARKGKYERDIGLLKKELETDPDNSRSVFYLAQSYRDIGNLPQAMEWYEKRTEMGGWDEEVWYSCYQVARLQHRLRVAWPLVLSRYLEAYRFRPSRLEPLFYVARFYRETEQYPLGFLFSRTTIETPYPDDILFVEKTVYQYELPQEYAICCSRIGKHEEAIRAFEGILSCADAPESYHRDAQANRLLCSKAIC